MASLKAGASSAPTSAGSENMGASSHLELSEKWSRQVLASLRSLNDSLAQVRQSVTKIDHVAQHKLQASKLGGGPAGSVAQTAAEPKPAQGFLAAAASLLHVGAPAPSPSTEALKALLLSPSLAGCAIDAHVVDELVRHLDTDTAAAVRVHLSTPPPAPVHVERARPHTPPPTSWHSPGKHTPGSASAADDMLHSARVAHSTLDAEVQTDAAAARESRRPKKHAHFSETGADAAVIGASAPLEDSSDEDSTPAAAGGRGRDEDTSEERALAEAIAHKGGKIKRNASNDKVSSMVAAADYDSDDDDAAVGTPAALEADIATVSAHLTAVPVGMLPLPVSRGMSKNDRHGVDTPKEPDGVHGPEHVFDSFRVPPAASATASTSSVPAAPKPRVMFRFQRFVEEPAGVYEDDGTGEDVPVNISEVSEAAFFAMEEEAAELRRMKAQLQALRAAREAEKRHEGAASAAAPLAAGAAPPQPPEGSTSDPMVIWEEADEPHVVDWFGGDAQWPTAAKVEADVDSDTEAAPTSDASASVDVDDITSTPSPVAAVAEKQARQRRFEAFALRVVYEAGRTGFEEAKEFNPPVGSIIAGRYIVRDFLGSAAFSSAIACDDLSNNASVCLKVIKNNKDFFDQSLDEIKLLRYINAQGDADAHHVLRLIDYFYHKEHLFLVTELLKDNLYEFQKYLRENGEEPYFTIPRIQRITKHILEALAFIHSKGLVHCDLKPENILIKSYSKCEVKVIDFGSSCFVTDHLSSYIQSRSYRAPEVVLGMPYGPKIDVWSLGCILCELLTGEVLFANDSVQTMLGRMQSIFGPFPQSMLDAGRDVAKYFSAKQVVYERMNDGTVTLYQPRRTSLRIRLRTEDADFLDFISALLTVDPDARPSAAQALRHPWLSKHYDLEPYVLPAM